MRKESKNWYYLRCMDALDPWAVEHLLQIATFSHSKESGFT